MNKSTSVCILILLLIGNYFYDWINYYLLKGIQVTVISVVKIFLAIQIGLYNSLFLDFDNLSDRILRSLTLKRFPYV